MERIAGSGATVSGRCSTCGQPTRTAPEPAAGSPTATGPRSSPHSRYSKRPTGVFHAADLPGQVDHRLALDQGHGRLRRTSSWRRRPATCDGLGLALLGRPARCAAQNLTAKTFGSRRTFFVTNGTSAANKIIAVPGGSGDIVLLDRNCHQSHHCRMMLGGANNGLSGGLRAQWPTIYGAVTLRRSSQAAGPAAPESSTGQDDRPDRCTFDGIVYDVQRVMEVPGDQARPGVLWDRSLVRVRPLPPGAALPAPRCTAHVKLRDLLGPRLRRGHGAARPRRGESAHRRGASGPPATPPTRPRRGYGCIPPSPPTRR